MKKLTALFLCLAILICMCSCKENKSNDNSLDNKQDDIISITPTPPENTDPPVDPTPIPDPIVDPVTDPDPVADPITDPEPAVDPEPVTPDPEILAKSVTVSYPVEKANGGVTYTALPSLPEIEYTVPDAENTRALSTEKIDFSYGAAKDGEPHSITVNNQKIFDSYGTNALAWDNKTREKVLYLTFDCGYEYQNITPQMIDILKEKNVPAAFFCTLDYIKDAPQAVKYMIEEGHIVGNHSVHHPSNSASLSREKLASEFLGVHNYLRVNFGYSSQYFRFPTGAFSENALDLAACIGYRSVFWSIAHADWDPENQPGVDKSFKTVTSRLHPGAVILLHTTSPDNLAILGDFIDYARSEGYTFKSLDDYAYWN